MGSITGFCNGLYYEIAGDGHPLVLIHGGLVNSGLWDDQFEVFAASYRTLRYDVRGFGKSKSPAAYYSNHGDLRDLLDDLGIEQAYVLGLSMGGAIAIDFTLAYSNRVAAVLPIAAGLSGYRTTTNSALRDELNAAYERGDKERAVELSLQMWTDGPHRTPDQVDPSVRERIRAMTAHTGSHREQGRYAIGIAQREVDGNRAAHREAQHIGARYSEKIQQVPEITVIGVISGG